MANLTGPYLFRSPGGGGSGSGSGGINYASTYFDGSTVTGINTYNDGASATPTDGTGGVVTGLSTTVVTSTPLRSRNQRFSKDGSNRQGMGWSWDFTVDRADYEGSRPIFISFRYDCSSGYVNNDLRLFVYDKDAGTLLNVLSLTGDGSVGASTTPTLYTGVFYPTSTSNDYRLIWHIAGTNASAFDIDMIDLVVGPDSPTPTAIVQDLGTETWTTSWSNDNNAVVKLKRIGNRVFGQATVDITGAGATNFDVTIPAAYTPNATYYDTSDGVYYVGGAGLIDTSGGPATYLGATTIFTSSTLRLYQVSSGYTTISSTVPMTWASGDRITFEFSYEVANWTSGASISSTEALFTTAKARYQRTSAQTVTTATILDASTQTFDTLNSVTTGASWKFTAPRSGYYRASATVQYVDRSYAVGNYAIVQLYKNGLFYSQGAFTEAETTTSIIIATNHTDTIYLAKGDYIDFRATNQGSGGTNTDGFHIQIEELPDFSIFSVYGISQDSSTTSGTKTPSNTNHYHQLTSNSLVLQPGKHKLKGSVGFSNSGSSPGYGSVGAGWYAANGADTSSQPALLSTISGLTVITAQANLPLLVDGSGSNYFGPLPEIVVQVTSPATVYLVSYSTQTTSANARITVYANAERIQ